MEGLKINPRYAFIGYRDIGEPEHVVNFGEGDLDNQKRIIDAVSTSHNLPSSDSVTGWQETEWWRRPS